MQAWLLGGLVASFTLSLALVRIHSLDYWWHLRIGRWIAENGRVPDVDVFSYTAAGARYLDVHWLHQLVLHAIHCLGGHEAVVLWQGAFALLLAGILWHSGEAGVRRRPEWIALLVALAIWLASGRFMPRPELPTFVLLAAVLALLERDRVRASSEGGSIWLWAIVPLQLVWANTHGLYILGIAACGIHLAGELLAPAFGSVIDRRRAARLVAVSIASWAVAVLNPNGVDLLIYPWIQLGMISERGGLNAPWVVELGRLFGSRADPTARLLVVALAGATAAALLLNRRRVPPSHILLFGAFAFLTLGAHRNQALFGIVAVPVFLHSWNRWLDARRPPPWLGALVTAVVAGLLVIGTVDGLRGRLQGRLSDDRPFGLGVAEGLQAVGAVDWIERERPPGELFHGMGDGGYLIQRLYPDYPVLLDGRLEVWGREKFERLNVGSPAGFHRLAAELGIGTALLNYRNQPYDGWLRELHADPEWSLVFVDDVAAVFVRSGAGFAPVDLASDVFAPLPEAETWRLRPRALARARFDFALQRFGPGLARWEAFREAYPEAADEPLLHAGLLLGNGRADDARALLDAAVEANPDDVSLLEPTAALRAQLGDAAGANELAARVFEIDPRRERVGGRITPRAAEARLAHRARKRWQGPSESAALAALVLALLAAAAHEQRRGPLPAGIPRTHSAAR